MTTLVIGGTGKTGSRVADRLTTMGHPFRIASRSTTPAFDWEDPTTWATCLVGVDRAYVTFAPDIAFAMAAETVGRFAKVAVANGVTADSGVWNA